MGFWEGTAKFESYSESGIWKVGSAIIFYGGGGSYEYFYFLNSMFTSTYAKLVNGAWADSGMALQGSINISGTTPDTSSPTITSIVYTPTSLIAPFPKTITVKANINEPGGSGIAIASVQLFSPSAVNGANASKTSASLTFNSTSGLYEGTAQIQNYYESGNWYVGLVTLSDRAGNNRYYKIDKTISLNNLVVSNDYITWPDSGVINPSFSVSGTTPDNSPPTINGLTFTPLIISGSGSVTAKLNASDLGLGISSASIIVKSPSSQFTCGVTTYKPISLTYNGSSGLWEGSLALTTSDEKGQWKVYYISVNDNAGNSTTYFDLPSYSTTHFVTLSGSSYVSTSMPLNPGFELR